MRLAGMMSGLDVHYDVGEGRPLLGRRMPNLDLITADVPMRVFTLLHDAQPVLLTLPHWGVGRSRGKISPADFEMLAIEVVNRTPSSFRRWNDPRGAGAIRGYRSCSDNFSIADLVNSYPHRPQSESRFLPGVGGVGPAAIIFRLPISLTRYPHRPSSESRFLRPEIGHG